jgi:hypothetical protein
MATQSEILFGDVGYTGAQPAEGLARFADLDYYRAKILEFQVQLNALAATADTILSLRDQVQEGDLRDGLDAWLADFYDNRGRLQLAADAVNAASTGADALGIRIPSISMPQQLSALPPAVLALIAAAAAGVAWSISYAIAKVSEARALVSRNELLATLPDDQKAAAIAASDQIATAQANAGGPLANIANVVKWLAIGAAVWFSFRALQGIGGQ